MPALPLGIAGRIKWSEKDCVTKLPVVRDKSKMLKTITTKEEAIAEVAADKDKDDEVTKIPKNRDKN